MINYGKSGTFKCLGTFLGTSHILSCRDMLTWLTHYFSPSANRAAFIQEFHFMTYNIDIEKYFKKFIEIK